MLDRQRFTRGVPIRPRDLEPVVVRRLKADLRRIDPRSFAKRTVDPIVLDGLPETAAELRLPQMLAAYGELRAKRIARLPPRHAANAKLAFRRGNSLNCSTCLPRLSTTSNTVAASSARSIMRSCPSRSAARS
jgi:hypothetical protein